MEQETQEIVYSDILNGLGFERTSPEESGKRFPVSAGKYFQQTFEGVEQDINQTIAYDERGYGWIKKGELVNLSFYGFADMNAEKQGQGA